MKLGPERLCCCEFNHGSVRHPDGARTCTRCGYFKTHGGARKGAGRPRGRTVTGRTLYLSDALWAKLDKLRGGLSVSRFLARKVESMRQSTTGGSAKHRENLAKRESEQPTEDKGGL